MMPYIMGMDAKSGDVERMILTDIEALMSSADGVDGGRDALIDTMYIMFNRMRS
ncbi:hypothetical protein ACHFCA_14830 [Delftia tsuruhatensis]